jgi:hypothetical protein
MITARAITNEKGDGFVLRTSLTVDPLFRTFVPIDYDPETEAYKHKVSDKNIGPRRVIQNYTWSLSMNELLIGLSHGR